jgi:kumamolisin
MGYEAIVDGQRINWAGGTSVAAPIWAAIIARMNQARRGAGLPRAGFVNPLLYQMATHKTMSAALRQITVGDSDVQMRVANGHGDAVPYLLNGYCAGKHWNPVTGLGVPDVQRLIDAALRRRHGSAR